MKWYHWVLIAFAAYTLIGYITLASGKNTIEADTGRIWNQVKTGGEKLDAIEAQLKGAYKDRQDLIDKITTARAAYKTAQDKGDLNGVTSAATQLGATLNVMLENYPSTDLSGLQRGTLDETAGIFNRIGYARDNLITDQKNQNNAEIWFPWLTPFFPHVLPLGGDTDPYQSGPKSNFGG